MPLFAGSRVVVTVKPNGDSIGNEIVVKATWREFIDAVRTSFGVPAGEDLRIYSERGGLVTAVEALVDQQSYFFCVGREILKPTFGNARRSSSQEANSSPLVTPVDRIKIILLGDRSVGKSSFLLRFSDPTNKLPAHMLSTVGVDFKVKNVELDGRRIKLQLWDTAGQERFRAISTSYIRDVHAVVLIYDVTNDATFKNTRTWMRAVHDQCDETVKVLLLGNKCDLPLLRAVTAEQGRAMAAEFGAFAFHEISAKTTEYDVIEKLVFDIARAAVKQLEQQRQSRPVMEPHSHVNLGDDCGSMGAKKCSVCALGS